MAIENKSNDCVKTLRDFIDAKKLKPPHQDRLLSGVTTSSGNNSNNSGLATTGRDVGDRGSSGGQQAYRNPKPLVDNTETEDCSTTNNSAVVIDSTYYRCKDNSSFNNKTYSNVKTSTFDESNFDNYFADESSYRPQEQQYHRQHKASPNQYSPRLHQQLEATRVVVSRVASSSSGSKPPHVHDQHHEPYRQYDDKLPPAAASKITASSSVNVNELASLISDLIDIKLQEKTVVGVGPRIGELEIFIGTKSFFIFKRIKLIFK